MMYIVWSGLLDPIIFIPYRHGVSEDVFCLWRIAVVTRHIRLLGAAAADHDWLRNVAFCHAEAELEPRQPVSGQYNM